METILTGLAIKEVQAGLNTAAPGADQTVMIFNPDGTPAGKFPARKLVQDMANIGSGYGTCSTGNKDSNGNEITEKVVTISDFLLLKNGIVSVLFTSGIDVADATLNVSSTGAKPIRINGAALQPGVVRPRMVVVMQYDGTAWNIIALTGLEQSQTDDSLIVDMGLPSGLKWAKANIDLTQANKFAASPYQYECSFFSWGNTDWHNPISNAAFEYDWGGINDNSPYYDGQVYGSTPGAKLTASMSASQDAARIHLGSPWRMPTSAEFKELTDNSYYMQADGETEVPSTTKSKIVTVNDVKGLYLKSKINGNFLFFACSGYGTAATWKYRGTYGSFWSSSFDSERNAYYLVFNSSGVYPQSSNNRYVGRAVRAVQ